MASSHALASRFDNASALALSVDSSCSPNLIAIDWPTIVLLRVTSTTRTLRGHNDTTRREYQRQSARQSVRQHTMLLSATRYDHSCAYSARRACRPKCRQLLHPQDTQRRNGDPPNNAGRLCTLSHGRGWSARHKLRKRGDHRGTHAQAKPPARRASSGSL